MLKAVFLCIILKGSEVSVNEDELPKINNSALGNNKSVAMSYLASSVNESANGFNNRSAQVIDENLESNRSTNNATINSPTAESVVMSNSTGFSNITDSHNAVNMSIEVETVLNITDTLSPTLELLNITDTISPTQSVTIIANISWETSNASNLSTVAELNLTLAPTLTPTISPVTAAIPNNTQSPTSAATASPTNITEPWNGHNQLQNRTEEEDHSTEKNSTIVLDPSVPPMTPPTLYATASPTSAITHITPPTPYSTAFPTSAITHIPTPTPWATPSPTSAITHITPPTRYSTASPTSAITLRPTDMPSRHPTAFPALPQNMKPAASTAIIIAPQEGEGDSGSSFSDVDGSGSSSSTKKKASHRGLIMVTVIIAILVVTVIIFCTYALRWCWRKWYGYSQIDLGGESVELGVIEDFFLNESFDSQDERTHLRHTLA